jgi:hypothetical protein
MAFGLLLGFVLGFCVGVVSDAKTYEKKIEKAETLEELKKWF